MTLREIAEHEAAHAVVALACGSLVFSMLLDGDASRVGSYHPNPHRAAIFAVAGNEQARRPWLGLGDARVFAEAIRELGEKPSAGHVWKYRLRARRILERHQAAVLALADALERAGRLRSDRGIRRVAFRASPELRQMAPRGAMPRMLSKLWRVTSAGLEPLEDRQLVFWSLAAFVEAERVQSPGGPR
jgi:hypothetical protein